MWSTAPALVLVVFMASKTVRSATIVSGIIFPLQVMTYSEIGYLISYGNGDAKRCSCRQVFTSLLAGSGAGMIPYTAEQLRGENGYLYALTLTGVPLREGNTVTFTVQSYARKTDGTELLGNSGTVDITVTDGVCSAEWRS